MDRESTLHFKFFALRHSTSKWYPSAPIGPIIVSMIDDDRPIVDIHDDAEEKARDKAKKIIVHEDFELISDGHTWAHEETN